MNQKKVNFIAVKPQSEEIALHEIQKVISSKFVKSRPGILTAEKIELQSIAKLAFTSWASQNALYFLEPREFTQLEISVRFFGASIKNETIQEPWHLCWLTQSENGFAIDKAKSLKLKSALQEVFSRIAKLSITEYPPVNTLTKGLFVFSFGNEILITREVYFNGQRRMKDDPDAPSRSFLKIEEAFTVFGKTPKVGNLVADLGAAPGGWSYAAAKYGAIVSAIDNGPMKKGAAGNPKIHHIRNDAFVWAPPIPTDWLLCDMVENPKKVLHRLEEWLKNRWCKYAIVNLKYGRTDPLWVLDECKHIQKYCIALSIRQLFHDRDEITLMLERKF